MSSDPIAAVNAACDTALSKLDELSGMDLTRALADLRSRGQ